MDAITERLTTCSSAIVHDVMREMGLSGFVLPAELAPLIPGHRFSGPVFTIEGRVEAGSDPHATLLDWTGLLSKAKSGHIWVCQPNDSEVGHMGELSGETLKKKGVLGCVVDGGIRDTERLAEMGFQCWRRFHTPRDIVGYWRPSGFDVPIVIGDVEIRPGDYLIGDGDGLVRLPLDAAETITARALEAMATENKVRTAILAGLDPQAAYLAHGKF